MNLIQRRLLCGAILFCVIIVFVPSSRADVIYTYRYTDIPTGLIGSLSWTVVRPGNLPAPFVATTFDEVDHPKFGAIFEVDFSQPEPNILEVLTLIDPYDPRYGSDVAYNKLTFFTPDTFPTFEFTSLDGRHTEFSIKLAPEPVPEPASLSLLFASALSVIPLRRARR